MLCNCELCQEQFELSLERPDALEVLGGFDVDLIEMSIETPIPPVSYAEIENQKPVAEKD